MRRAAIVNMAVLLAASTVSAAESQWIEVTGGAWQLDSETLVQLQTAVEVSVGSEAKRRGRELRPLNAYTFQYQGRIEGKRRYIWLNALCSVLEEEYDLAADFYQVFDGGSCYFNVQYDPETRRLSRLQINAVR